MIEPTPSGSWVKATAKPNIPSDREFNLEFNDTCAKPPAAVELIQRKPKDF